MDYQNRVVKEKEELDEKLEKLRSFMTQDLFLGLPESERQRLDRQSFHMSEYSKVLGERILNF